jgi:hypothetical protein
VPRGCGRGRRRRGRGQGGRPSGRSSPSRGRRRWPASGDTGSRERRRGDVCGQVDNRPGSRPCRCSRPSRHPSPSALPDVPALAKVRRNVSTISFFALVARVNSLIVRNDFDFHCQFQLLHGTIVLLAKVAGYAFQYNRLCYMIKHSNIFISYYLSSRPFRLTPYIHKKLIIHTLAEINQFVANQSMH